MTPEHAQPQHMCGMNRLGFTKRGNWGGPVLSFGPGGPLGHGANRLPTPPHRRLAARFRFARRPACPPGSLLLGSLPSGFTSRVALKGCSLAGLLSSLLPLNRCIDGGWVWIGFVPCAAVACARLQPFPNPLLCSGVCAQACCLSSLSKSFLRPPACLTVVVLLALQILHACTCIMSCVHIDMACGMSCMLEMHD